VTLILKFDSKIKYFSEVILRLASIVKFVRF
jgi:hypothetical protein